MVYLQDRHQIFLFGGFTANDRVDDTWLYDIESNTWTMLHPSDKPTCRSDAAIAYDPENQAVVLFGGYEEPTGGTDDTWAYSFAEGNWVQMSPGNSPLRQYGHHMMYDQVNSRLLMYPGLWKITSGSTMLSHGYGDQVWEYDVVADDWTELSTTPKPAGRYWFNLAYLEDGRLLMHGGSGGGDSQRDDTWTYEYQSNTWTRIESPASPPERACSSMAYDPVNGVVVLFGGSDHGADETYGDTWLLDLEAGQWTEVGSTSVEPPPSETENEASTGIPGFPSPSVALGLILVSLFVFGRRF